MYVKRENKINLSLHFLVQKIFLFSVELLSFPENATKMLE